jgi:hypothetical protein
VEIRSSDKLGTYRFGFMHFCNLEELLVDFTQGVYSSFELFVFGGKSRQMSR